MTCTHCQAQTADGLYLCPRCVHELRETVGQIGDALAVAEDTVGKRDRTGPETHGGSQSSTPPVNLGALAKVTNLEELVHSWARMILEHDSAEMRGVEPLAYLRMSVDVVAGHEWAGDMLGELAGAVRMVWRAVDLPPDAIDLGECGNGDCQGRIHGQWSKTPDGGRRVSESARCRSCRARYNGREVYALQIARTHGQLRGLRETERLLKSIDGAPSRRTIRRWIDRKMLRNWGTEAEPQVEPAAILTIMRQMERGRVELT